MDADATVVTRRDLKEFRQELRLEMTHLEHRLTNKIGAIVIGTAKCDDVFRSFSAVFSINQMAVCDCKPPKESL